MKLNDIPKRQPYQVPEGYFDRLPMRIMEHTAAPEAVAPAPWHEQLWRPVRLAVAPLLLLLVFVGVYFFNVQQPQAPASIASLSNAEIIHYLDSYTHVDAADFEQYGIADRELAVEFLNVSSKTAEEELEYYQLNNLDY
ncbi:hypothetical protein [Pontibacter rugosus]|uniref:Uncharacterized protein n=1 Tax=Pontibacter rugosus TaxID=1745966 RepID=A0ABW3SQ93_9BACT